MSTPTEAMTEHLPWHQPIWSQLSTAWSENRWPHALLIHGPEGVGKRSLAVRIASAILCAGKKSDFGNCGVCAACKLLHSGTHPDWTLIAPEEDKQQISIDQIREVSARLALTSYRPGSYKVALIDPAHQMTGAAANSLLKTLEEPTPNTAIILLTARPGALLPTLRSRCSQLKIAVPSEAVTASWLEAQGKGSAVPLLSLVGGAPLRALNLADGKLAEVWDGISRDVTALLAGQDDVTHIAKRWSNESLGERLDGLDHWLCSIIRRALVGTADPITRTPLPRSPVELNISRLYGCLDRLRQLKAQLAKTSLQRELAVDAVLIDVLDAFQSRR